MDSVQTSRCSQGSNKCVGATHCVCRGGGQRPEERTAGCHRPRMGLQQAEDHNWTRIFIAGVTLLGTTSRSMWPPEIEIQVPPPMQVQLLPRRWLPAPPPAFQTKIMCEGGHESMNFILAGIAVFHAKQARVLCHRHSVPPPQRVLLGEQSPLPADKLRSGQICRAKSREHVHEELLLQVLHRNASEHYQSFINFDGHAIMSLNLVQMPY
jgi:hypothetical protein